VWAPNPAPTVDVGPELQGGGGAARGEARLRERGGWHFLGHDCEPVEARCWGWARLMGAARDGGQLIKRAQRAARGDRRRRPRTKKRDEMIVTLLGLSPVASGRGCVAIATEETDWNRLVEGCHCGWLRATGAADMAKANIDARREPGPCEGDGSQGRHRQGCSRKPL